MRSHPNRAYPRAALGVTRLEDRETPSATPATTGYAGAADDLRASFAFMAVPTAGASAGPRATTTSLVAAATSVPLGKPVNLTVAVRSPAGAPPGTVTFRDGTREIGRAGLSNGRATLSTSGLAAGTHRITAWYDGSPTFGGSASAAVTVTISSSASPPGTLSSTGATTTTLTSVATAVAPNRPVSLTARVRPAAGGTVTGTVTFKDGGRVLGTATLRNGAATFSTSGLAAGTHRLTATYAGSSSLNGSNSLPVTVTIGAAAPPPSSAVATTTSVSASSSASTAGQRVTLTATVRPATGSSTPGGTVTFRDGATVIGTAALSGGRAVLAARPLPAGAHSFTAVYGGSSAFRPSASAVARVAVSSSATSRTSTTTSVSSSATSATAGSPITFTATVRRSSGTSAPTGTVTFRDGTVIVGTVAVTLGGTAALTLRSLRAGAHAVTATYNGDARYAASASPTRSVTVTAAPAAVGSASAVTTVIPQPGSSASRPVTVKAKVTTLHASSVAPTGRVTFRTDNVVLGTATLDRTGVATLVLPARTLSAGQNYVTAFYEGDRRYAADGGADFLVLTA